MFLSWTLAEGSITTGIAQYTTTIDVGGIVTAVADSQGNQYIEGTDYTVTDGQVTIISTGNIAEGTELTISTNNVPTQSEEDLGVITSAGDTELLVLDIPLIQDSDPDYTLYLAAGGGTNWNGAAIYLSTDNSRYIFSNTFATYSIYGSCVSDFDSYTVTVQVNKQELESVTDSDLALGFNLAVIGDQIIQFKTAQLIDTNTYQLTEITSGLRGTENEPLAQTGDRFVLLQGENAVIKKIQGSASDIGEVRYIKAVSNDQTLDEATAVQITVQGNAQKPYAPVNLAATKDSLGNITFTWQRRDRHAALNTVNPPLSEATEEYSINISDGTLNLRTDTSNSQTYDYSISNQIIDFGVIQNTIIFSVAQVSADVGAGTYATAELTPTVLEPIPTITSFAPVSAPIGATISVTGTGLTQLSSVSINGIEQTNLAVVDNQNISFAITSGTVSGNIELTTSGGTATSSIPLIIETALPTQKPNFPTPNPVTLPYTIIPTDDGTEIIINGQTNTLSIPDDGSAFESGWGCYVSLDGIGNVTLLKEDGSTTGILGTNSITNNQTVKLWHRGGNIWKID